MPESSIAEVQDHPTADLRSLSEPDPPESAIELGRSEKSPATAAHRSGLYSRFAPLYDAVWPTLMAKRLSEAIRSAEIDGGCRVLEVGVGTGAALRYYPKECDVVGVDLSESMLAEARQHIAENRWSHIDVQTMNAEDLEFEDNQFDVVTSFHTISVVSDPRAMMSEMVRVCRPGGTILVVNHFRSPNPLIAGVVDRATNFTRRLGWRTDLDIESVIKDLPLAVESRHKTNPFSLFTILRCTCRKPLE